MSFGFKLLSTDPTGARLGRVSTPHGQIDTPVFMPVGTRATVKGVLPEQLKDLGASIILANTYHLYLRPGHEVIGEFGGLHGFMGWDGPILTDSGGFQIWSLGALRKLDDHGVRFSSHIDGTSYVLTPESAIGVQESLGADIIMCLDECAPHPAQRDYVERSVELTARWAKRCKTAKTDPRQALFGIVQGGMYPDLRKISAERTVEIGFDGYAVGGLSVGEEKPLMHEVLSATTGELPSAAPRYLMGVGTPEDLVYGVGAGVDMFDCVMPSRNARNGTLFTRYGKLVIKNGRYERDHEPIEQGCGCYTCSKYSRAYLRHLFMSKELVSYTLNTIHNLYYYVNLMGAMRSAIGRGGFDEWRAGFYSDISADNAR